MKKQIIYTLVGAADIRCATQRRAIDSANSEWTNVFIQSEVADVRFVK